MFTYNLQSRLYRTTGQHEKLVFPNVLKATIEYEPKTALLAEAGSARSVLIGSNLRLVFNANTGKTSVESDSAPFNIETVVTFEDATLTQNGAFLSVEALCNDPDDLHNFLFYFAYVYPTVLNIYFEDPVTAKQVRGFFGTTEFNWEFEQSQGAFRVVDQKDLEEFCQKSLMKVNSLRPETMASLKYFHNAVRLMQVGSSPWDFTAEAILNYVKCLESIFGASRDKVRAGLVSLGYSAEQIESDFIPLFLLRSEFDVAHIRAKIPPHAEVQILYQYLLSIERTVREVLEKWLESPPSAEGSRSKPGITYDEKDTEAFGKIIESVKKATFLQGVK